MNEILLRHLVLRIDPQHPSPLFHFYTPSTTWVYAYLKRMGSVYKPFRGLIRSDYPKVGFKGWS